MRESGGRLLVKFIFTSEKLSVQVHPDDTFAARRMIPAGRPKCGVYSGRQPGAKIAAGFREPISQEKLEAAALSGEIQSLLHWFDAAAGDTCFISASTVHAVGAGLTLCEIGEHSDVTYRLYDYGRPRELHLPQALAVSQLVPIRRGSSRQPGPYVDCEYSPRTGSES